MALQHYVVQTVSESLPVTKLALTKITELGYPTIWLATRVPSTDRYRRTKIQEAPLFPGYLFVEFDLADDGWKDIPQQRGVRRLLGSDPMRPTPLSGGAVERLKAKFEAGEFSPKAPTRIEIDDRIVVEIGPFAGKIGVCTLSKGERIEAMAAEFGGRFVFHRGMVRRAPELAVA